MRGDAGDWLNGWLVLKNIRTRRVEGLESAASRSYCLQIAVDNIRCLNACCSKVNVSPLMVGSGHTFREICGRTLASLGELGAGALDFSECADVSEDP